MDTLRQTNNPKDFFKQRLWIYSFKNLIPPISWFKLYNPIGGLGEVCFIESLFNPLYPLLSIMRRIFKFDIWFLRPCGFMVISGGSLLFSHFPIKTNAMQTFTFALHILTFALHFFTFALHIFTFALQIVIYTLHLSFCWKIFVLF